MCYQSNQNPNCNNIGDISNSIMVLCIHYQVPPLIITLFFYPMVGIMFISLGPVNWQLPLSLPSLRLQPSLCWTPTGHFLSLYNSAGPVCESIGPPALPNSLFFTLFLKVPLYFFSLSLCLSAIRLKRRERRITWEMSLFYQVHRCSR